jgi:type II secretory pathway pseudopilin PulG
MYDLIPLAAEAAGSTLNSVTGIVVAVIMAIVSAFAVPFLKARQTAAEAEVKAQEAIAMDANMSARQKLVARVKAFLWGRAAAIAEKEFPNLATVIKQSLANKDDKTTIWKTTKEILYGWGKDLRTEAKDYFSKQGIDLAAALGDDYLDKLIERAANAVSPFPGRDTAKTMLQDKVTDWLVDRGVNWVRNIYLKEDGPHAPVAA